MDETRITDWSWYVSATSYGAENLFSVFSGVLSRPEPLTLQLKDSQSTH